MTVDQVVDGRCAQAPFAPAGGPSAAAPAVRPPRVDPCRSLDDHNPTPWQVALAAQDLLDRLLGDEPFDLAEAAPIMASLARFTEQGHAPDRLVWSSVRVLSRVAELVDTYNPPPELGGDLPPAAELDAVITHDEANGFAVAHT